MSAICSGRILFESSDQGKPKATTAKARILALNPDITINAHDEALTDKNAISLFSGYDIVVDGTDNFSAKFLVNDGAVKLGKPVVYGAIEGFEGQVAVFNHDGGACYCCLHPQPPQAAVMNCAEAGVIGALAGITGTLQAMEVIKLIVGHSSFETLTGKLWMIDARTMATDILKIPKREDCRACSRPAEEIVLHSPAQNCATGIAAEICSSEKIPDNAVFIDVREIGEWNAGHITNARHLPLQDLQKNPEIFSPPGKSSCCVVYCQKGERSRKAAEILLRAGHTNIYSLKGGYEAWTASKRRSKSQ